MVYDIVTIMSLFCANYTQPRHWKCALVKTSPLPARPVQW